MVDEKILVVPARKLFSQDTPQGFLKTDLDHYSKLIVKEHELVWRESAEKNYEYKQIIPYMIFSFQDKIFVMQRRATASETRLRSKFSVGIGGHIRQEDFEQGDDLFAWAQREFHEEVCYQGEVNVVPLGIINDESTNVGRVHAGFVYLIKGTSPHISIRDEHKSGILVSVKDCKQLYEKMEGWSKYLLDYLLNNDHLLG